MLWSKGSPGTYLAHKSADDSMYIRLACDESAIQFRISDSVEVSVDSERSDWN